MNILKKVIKKNSMNVKYYLDNKENDVISTTCFSNVKTRKYDNNKSITYIIEKKDVNILKRGIDLYVKYLQEIPNIEFEYVVDKNWYRFTINNFNDNIIKTLFIFTALRYIKEACHTSYYNIVETFIKLCEKYDHNRLYLLTLADKCLKEKYLASGHMLSDGRSNVNKTNNYTFNTHTVHGISNVKINEKDLEILNSIK